MTVYNTKHKTIISGYEKPINKNPKNGETCAHTVEIRSIELFRPISDTNTFLKIELSRDFILDLAEQVKKLESETITKEYYDFPF